MHLRSRKTRATLDFLKKAFVWAFLAIFVFSIVGVTLVQGFTRR